MLKIKNILTLPFMYSIVTKNISLASLEKRNSMYVVARFNVILSNVYTILVHKKPFPTTTRHVHVVVQIKCAAHITLQILTQPYEVILCDSTSQRIHRYFNTNYLTHDRMYLISSLPDAHPQQSQTIRMKT